MRKTERQKKFDKLILKMYDLWKIDNGFVCIIYTAINHMNFTEVSDIKEAISSSCNVDCIYLQSKQTGEDIKICSWDLDNISIRVYETGIIRIKQKTGMKKLVQIPYK